MERHRIETPLSKGVVDKLRIGDIVEIYGKIYTGRDAILPKLVERIASGSWIGPNLIGAVIFHTGVSDAGVGPTTSSKVEIESSISHLSRAGVLLHLGKGELSSATVDSLAESGALFAITPPTSALFRACTKGRRVVAFAEEGMEAMHELDVVGFPAVIAVAQGATIWRR